MFPGRERRRTRQPPPGSAFHLQRGSETILLAEDDDSVRVVMVEVLRDLGYRVLEAREGREALSVAAAHAGKIDLLLADVVMPGFGGSELLHRGSRGDRACGCSTSPGVTDDASCSTGLPTGAVLLQKPFSPWSLASRRARCSTRSHRRDRAFRASAAM